MSRDYKSRNSSKSANEKGGAAFFGGFVGYALGLVSAIGIWLYISYAPSPFLPAEKSENRPTLEQSKSPTKPAQEEPVSVAEEKPRFDFYKILPGIDEPEIDQTNRRGGERLVQPPVAVKVPESSSKPIEIVQQPMPVQPGFNTTEPPKQHSASVHPRNTPTEIVQQSTIPQAKSIKPTEKYFLQVGSFRKNDDAENLKARLALLGVFASIQPIDLAERGVWYRVRVGPFTKKEDVDETSASLRENGIATQFVKMP